MGTNLISIILYFFPIGSCSPTYCRGGLPIVGRALKQGGAFYIRRSWGEDQLYGSVVEEYVEGLLVRGHNVECFIEGTRSRTGKLLPPKLDVLKIILECILSEGQKIAGSFPCPFNITK